MYPIVISAPGKVILHGEHAVVYDKRALAGSLGLRTSITLCRCDKNVVTVDLPVISINLSWDCSELLQICQGTISDAELSQPKEATDTQMKELKKFAQFNFNDESDTRRLAVVAFLHLFTSISVKNGTVPSVSIEITSHLPASAGLGSSAAYSTCLAAALLTHRGYLPTDQEWTLDQLNLINQWAFVAEKIIHGRPSGIDNAISTFGGALFFQSGTITPFVSMPNLNILLINTKVSRSTKALVEQVRLKYNKYPEIVKPVLESIEAITECCQKSLEQIATASNDASSCHTTLQELVEMNQHHLRLLGVSHACIEKVCHMTSQHGLISKLTGAGGGGCVFCIIPPGFSTEVLDELMQLLKGAGFDCFQSTLGGPGVRLEIKACSVL